MGNRPEQTVLHLGLCPKDNDKHFCEAWSSVTEGEPYHIQSLSPKKQT